MATINGTNNNDTITPSGVSSGVTGGLPSNADDTINSRLGKDTVDGGGGNDLLIVDYSSNTYTGTSYAAGIRTYIDGGVNGHYTAYYNNSSSNFDRVQFSNIERFQITGTIANDTITTGDGNDTIKGGAGNDTIDGGLGINVIDGGDGNDVIDGGIGINIVVNGGAGTDILVNGDFSAATTTLNFNETGTASGTNISNVERFQNLTTGSGNDVISFSERFDNGRIKTGSGDDTINSGLGKDTVDGGDGSDLLIVDYSSNTYTGTSYAAGIRTYIDGGVNGHYTAYYNNSSSNFDRVQFSNIERFQITGTIANDTITTGDGNDTIKGGAGNDTITTKEGNDSINGGAGNDSLTGGTGNDILVGGPRNDTLTGGTGSDRFLYNTNAAFTTSTVGVDRLADFTGGTDKIVLDKTTFTTLTSVAGNGFNINSEFAVVVSDAAAATTGALIAYSSATGNLFYNQNGAAVGFGSGAQFATLTGIPQLTAADFIIQV